MLFACFRRTEMPPSKALVFKGLVNGLFTDSSADYRMSNRFAN